MIVPLVGPRFRVRGRSGGSREKALPRCGYPWDSARVSKARTAAPSPRGRLRLAAKSAKMEPFPNVRLLHLRTVDVRAQRRKLREAVRRWCHSPAVLSTL